MPRGAGPAEHDSAGRGEPGLRRHPDRRVHCALWAGAFLGAAEHNPERQQHKGQQQQPQALEQAPEHPCRTRAGTAHIEPGMGGPWQNATYLVEKNPLYERWDRRWRDVTRRLDDFQPSGHAVADGVMLSVLTDGVKTAELLRNDAALTERWNLDPAALAALMRVQTWDPATIAYWLRLSARSAGSYRTTGRSQRRRWSPRSCRWRCSRSRSAKGGPGFSRWPRWLRPQTSAFILEPDLPDNAGASPGWAGRHSIVAIVAAVNVDAGER